MQTLITGAADLREKTASIAPILRGIPYLRDLVATPETIGKSGASVFRLGSRFYAKTALLPEAQPLREEAARLSWLKDAAFPCAPVRELIEHDGQLCMITERLPGENAARADLEAEQKATLIADALKHLHGLSDVDCPFDECLDVKLLNARTRVESGDVDEEDFDEARLGLKAADLFQQVAASRPAQEDLVVTHGDASLPNFIFHGDQLSGVLDCGKLGVADRYQDLAIAAASLKRNCGAASVPIFFNRYGISRPDPDRIAYYQFLDEFF